MSNYLDVLFSWTKQQQMDDGAGIYSRLREMSNAITAPQSVPLCRTNVFCQMNVNYSSHLKTCESLSLCVKQEMACFKINDNLFLTPLDNLKIHTCCFYMRTFLLLNARNTFYSFKKGL